MVILINNDTDFLLSDFNCEIMRISDHYCPIYLCEHLGAIMMLDKPTGVYIRDNHDLVFSNQDLIATSVSSSKTLHLFRLLQVAILMFDPPHAFVISRCPVTSVTVIVTGVAIGE